jgi:hypothetical protein
LKYDVLDLDLLLKVFRHILPQEVADFVAETPSGRFARQIGFWYEVLTGVEVPLNVRITGNYESLLDPDFYVTAQQVVNDTRWRIGNNALGSSKFLPIIRRTPAIRAAEQTDWRAMIAETFGAFSQEVLRRAMASPNLMEPPSAFAIQCEDPAASRAEKFAAILLLAGIEQQPLAEEVLTRLQNAIVDARYRESGFRTHQNYLSQTTPYFQEMLHTLGAPPAFLPDLMEGLDAYFSASEDVSPVVRAAAISFPFIYIRPFEDGNGRLHRYLIHDILARAQIGGQGVIIPVSEEIRINNLCLEQFSKPLLAAAEYSLNEAGLLTVQNPADLEGFYRYPDLTLPCECLAQVLEQTIRKAVPQDIHLLEKWDRARAAITEIVDLPDRLREQILIRLLKFDGKLAPNRTKGEFPELTEQEISNIETAYHQATAPSN